MPVRETLLGRRLWALGAIAAALLVLAAATGRPAMLAAPSAWLNEAVAPVEVAVTALERLAAAGWRFAAGFWYLRQENAVLTREVLQLEQEQAGAAEAQAENQHLTALLGLRSAAAAEGLGQGIAAPVVARGADGWWNALVVGRGAAAGVRPGMVAVSPAGDLVGVVEPGVGPTSARVRLMTNPDFGVGVAVLRGSSRDEGVAIGQLANPLLTATFFATDPNVQPGDVLVTSGLSTPGAPDAFPPGLTVGTVKAVAGGAFGMTRQAVVVPAADLDALTDVLLLPGGGAAP
jgi:rod shape-determining protein MreC